MYRGRVSVAAHSPVAPRGRPFRNHTYRRLFAAQAASLVGTGLTTVGLALLAYDLAGASAGSVLGIALAIKMVAYVGITPVAAAFTRNLDRKRLLVGLDLGRLLVVAALPFVDAVWQVYALVFVLSACSAAFTPAFQALLPVVLPDEADYTQALSWTRVAYDLENLLSPALAAVVVGLFSYHELFVGDGLTFLLSAGLVTSSRLPQVAAGAGRSGWRTITRGIHRYLQVPRLRALLALNLAVAAASATVIVNTVVYVRDDLHRGDGSVAFALAVAGAGSLLTALAIPALLRRWPERAVLLAGGALLPVALVALAVVDGWLALLALWFVIGVGLSAVQTPAGRLIQRAVLGGDGPELFAAQFSLSHACWLLTYPLAGVLGEALGLSAAALVLGVVAGAAVMAAAWLWPRSDGRS